MADPRKVFGQILVELGKENPKVLAVSCDSGAGSGMSPFKQQLPEQFVEIGISEQNAIGLCAGLAVNGFIPVVSAIAPFISMRCYEQVRDDIGYVNTNVKIIGSSSGISQSQLGSTHQANEDIALMRTIPHMVVLNPGDPFEVEMCLREAVKWDGPVYIRMPRQGLENLAPADGRSFRIGKGEVLSEGEYMILASGTTSSRVIKACELLRQQGLSVGVLNLPTVWPLDEELIRQYARTCKCIFTVEEHSVVAGLGGAVAELLAPMPDACPLHILGIPAGAKETGPYEELLDFYGLSGEKLAAAIENLVV